MIEPAEPPHSHHQRTGIPWFDLVMALTIVFISVASLLTSLHSEKSMEALVEQNSRLVSAQSTPLLMYDSTNETGEKPVITMTLSNVGTGPAQIYWLKAEDGQGLDYSGGALTSRVMQVDPKGQPITQQINSSLMRSGDERWIFKWARPTSGPAAIAAWNQLNVERRKLHMSACYCSIFEECRITEFGMTRPKLVKSCERSESSGM